MSRFDRGKGTVPVPVGQGSGVPGDSTTLPADTVMLPATSPLPTDAAAPAGLTQPQDLASSTGPAAPADTGGEPTGSVAAGQEQGTGDSSGVSLAPPPQHTIRTTRAGMIYASVVAFALVLVLLVVFIAQNGQHVTVSFISLHGRFSLGLAMLASAVAGALLVAIPSLARVIQLRRTARRHRLEHEAASAQAASS